MSLSSRSKKHSLGTLESDIMDALWTIHCGSVRDVLNAIKKKRSAAYTTIMTVMTRLHEKGLVKRKMDHSGAYLYCPAQGKEDFMRTTSKQALASILKEYGEVAITQFVDLLEQSTDADLKKWKAKLKKLQ